MRRWLVIIGVVVAFTGSAFGHTTQICMQCNPDGSSTFYAGTYHGSALSPIGGIIVDGNTTGFTGFVMSLPSGVTNCTNLCPGFPPIDHWQTVTVTGLSNGSHTLTTTATTGVEDPRCDFVNLTTVCPFCGDGNLDSGETCDDGNNNDCDGCRGDCSSVEGACGDGFCCEDSCSCPEDCGTAVACDDNDPASGLPCGEGARRAGELCNAVPTVSEWGLIVTAMLGLATGTVLYGRRRLARS